MIEIVDFFLFSRTSSLSLRGASKMAYALGAIKTGESCNYSVCI